MKRLNVIFALILTLAALPVKAQYYSINVDYGTMEAMSEAFTTEAAMEALHNENLQKIYDSYKAAEVASAGIFIMRTFKKSMTVTRLPRLPVPVSFHLSTLTGEHSRILICGMTVRKTTITTVSIRLSHVVSFQR